MQHKTVYSLIVDFLFGHKYYANIINTRGVDKCEICSFIFHSREEAERHRRDVESTMTFQFVETVSFRSRMDYPRSNR